MKQKITEFLRLVLAGLKQSPHVIRDSTVESVNAVGSPDIPTRRMAWFFILSLLGLLITLGFFGRYLYERHQVKKAHQAALLQAEAERRALEEEIRKRNRLPTYQTLGGFSLELREKPGVVRPRNSMGSAEMEIVVACDEPAVCEYVEKNIDAARGELLPLFVPTDREKILSVPGKKAFRDEIRLQLNRWLQSRNIEEGKIIEVLLPKFIVS